VESLLAQDLIYAGTILQRLNYLKWTLEADTKETAKWH
jgi:hypothetical protein